MSVSLVVMGVSGSGKTTLAQALSARLGWVFQEGDLLHPAANIAKMSAGIALNDADRRPWLEAVARFIGENEAANRDVIVTCSALKRSYRDIVRLEHPSVRFLFIEVPAAEVARRLAHRTGHYMPASLLPSQLEALEPLQADEPGVVTTPGESIEALLERI